LPSQRDDEFRPFVRRLPEWQFWYAFFPLSHEYLSSRPYQVIFEPGDVDRTRVYPVRSI
jgi:hypothetical protein